MSKTRHKAMKSFPQVLNVENTAVAHRALSILFLGLTSAFGSNQQFRQCYYYY